MENLASLSATLEARRADRETAFQDLASELAAGGLPAADTVEIILSEAGKTVAELEAATKLKQARRELKEVSNDYGPASKELAAIDDDQTQDDAEQQVAQHQYAVRTAARSVKRQGPLNRMRTAKEAFAELRRTASPALHKKREQLQRRQASSEAQQRELKDAIDKAQVNLEILRARSSRSDSFMEIENTNKRLAGYKSQLDQTEASLSALAEESARLEQEFLEA